MHSQNSRKRTRMNFGRESYQLWPRNEGTFSAELGLNVGQSSFILRSKFLHSSVKVPSIVSRSRQKTAWKDKRNNRCQVDTQKKKYVTFFQKYLHNSNIMFNFVALLLK